MEYESTDTQNEMDRYGQQTEPIESTDETEFTGQFLALFTPSGPSFYIAERKKVSVQPVCSKK